MFNSTKLLSGVSALAVAVTFNATAIAQDAPETAEGGEFLGTITLGESKREVQTDTAVPVTTIDRTEIDDRQAGTIAELIDSVPGVTLVNGSTPIGSGINIRGFGANGTYGTDQKVALLIDGATTGAEELYRIGTQLFTDPYLYRAVSVQRGTVGSFEYGSGIVGGIVRLETIDASDLTGGETGFKWAQTLGAASNQDAYNTSTTLAWQPAENVEFLANYSYREQDNQEDGNGDEIGNSAFELPSYLVKGRFTFGDQNAHALEASYANTDSSDRDVPYDTFVTTADAFGNVDRDTTSETAALTYTYAPGGDLIDLEVALTYANQEIDQSYVPGSSPLEGTPTFPFLEPLVNAEQQYETTKLTVKNQSYIDMGSVSHDMRYGFELLERKRLDASSAPGGTDQRYALFLVDEIALSENLTFTPALRYESSDIDNAGGTVSYDNDALMGGASLRYEFSTGFALFGSYAYTESLPILDDLTNPTFMQQAEVATTYELGASYDRIGVFTGQDMLAAKVNFYSTELDDVTSYAGVNKVDVEGFEIEASYAMRSGAYIDLNANFTTGDQYDASGASVDWQNIPQDTIRFTLGQRLNQTLDLSAEVLNAFDLTQSTAGGDVDYDGFTVVNLRATYAPNEGFLEGTQFRIGVENLFDEDYRPNLSTRNAPGQNVKFTVSRVFF